MGRLGNQLFQIASTIGIAKKNGDDFAFPEWEYSGFFKNKIPTTQIFPNNIYTERGFHYNQITGKNIDLVGYFQSSKYFNEFEEIIREYFSFNEDLLISEDLSNFCSIHVRRTDYLNLPDYHPFPGIDYYSSSIDYMRNLGISNFIVFSDDIEWCKKNLSHEFVYSENNLNIRDLALMTKCKNHIIANSSFSWWGAWLNKKPDKTVIAPKKWFGPAKKGVILDDLYCENWLKL